jgi:hypothetical protein
MRLVLFHINVRVDARGRVEARERDKAERCKNDDEDEAEAETFARVGAGRHLIEVERGWELCCCVREDGSNAIDAIEQGSAARLSTERRAMSRE